MQDEGHCLHPSPIPNPGPTECILSSLYFLVFAIYASNGGEGEGEEEDEGGRGEEGGGRGEGIDQLVKHKLFKRILDVRASSSHLYMLLCGHVISYLPVHTAQCIWEEVGVARYM